MEQIDFVALGYCSNDYLAILPEIPLDGKVQILEQMVQGGGPAATAGVAAARLGMKTGFVGVVGDDEHGARIRRDLESEGIYTGAMQIRKDCSSSKEVSEQAWGSPSENTYRIDSLRGQKDIF